MLQLPGGLETHEPAAAQPDAAHAVCASLNAEHGCLCANGKC